MKARTDEVWEYVDPSLAADKVERLVAPLKPSVIGRWVPDLSAGLDLLGREGPLPDLTTAPASAPPSTCSTSSPQ
jgi:hypothetical protein